MATENIQIKFTVDKTQLDGAVASSKTLEAELKKAGVSAQYMDSALEGVDEALKEAGVDAKTFNKALEQSAQSTKTLRTQLAEAKNEAVRMSQQFGAFSKEAQNAAKKAALIKDEIGDLNDTLDALNPDAKLNAFVKLGQGIQGGFQAATGALQLFGVENERITKLAQQFQGVLNLTQGINSVLQLKDVYGQLRLVLGVTATAQRGLNVAMAANPAGAIALAVGALITAVILLNDETKAYKLTEEELTKIKQDAIGATEGLKDAEDALAIQRDKNATFDIQRRKETERLQKDLVDLFINQKKAEDELNQSKKEYNELGLGASRILVQERTERLRLALETKDLADKAIQDRLKEYKLIRETITLKELEATKSKEAAQKKKADDEDILRSMQKIPLEVNKLKNSYELLGLSSNGFQKLTDVFNILEAQPYEVKKAVEELKKELKDLEPVMVKITKTSADLDKELFERLDKEKQQRRDNALFALSVAQETASVIATFSQAQYTEELQALEESKRQGAISEERYQEKLRKIKRKAAEEDKKYQIFAATMGAAQAIIAALSTTPAPARAAAVALASIIGAANLAKIAATPIPKFKTGTLNVGGGNVDADGGMHAIIHRGEAVIPADRNRDYHPTISALFKRQIKPSDINSFVEMKLKGRMNNTVNAKINARELAGVMPKNDKVELRNSALLARQIGKEIARNNDPRMR
jgi:chromosome segregation ATPase